MKLSLFTFLAAIKRGISQLCISCLSGIRIAKHKYKYLFAKYIRTIFSDERR